MRNKTREEFNNKLEGSFQEISIKSKIILLDHNECLKIRKISENDDTLLIPLDVRGISTCLKIRVTFH